MKIVYIAHPLGNGSDREKNRANASRWCVWALLRQKVCPVADWIVLSGVLDESFREPALDADFALIERCDELWLVGGRISPGMALEKVKAENSGVTVVDLTHLGYEAPSCLKMKKLDS